MTHSRFGVRRKCAGDESGAPGNDLDKRTVQCLGCRWLSRIPWSIEPGDARGVAEGLARLHQQNEHSGSCRLQFELTNMGLPKQLELHARSRAESPADGRPNGGPGGRQGGRSGR